MKNKYEIRGDTTAVLVRCKKEILECLIDTSDFEKVNSHPGIWAAANNSGSYYVRGNSGKKKIYIHRIITDPPSGMVVDHFNHDTLDNRKSNLRVVTVSQNAQNLKGARVDNRSSGVRGVCWDKQKEKWMVNIWIDKKPKHFGYYDDLEQAKLVSKLAIAKYMPYSKEAIELSELMKHIDIKLPEKKNKSGSVGVYWHKVAKKWRSKLTVNGSIVYCELFNKFDDAVAARKEAEKRYTVKQSS